MGTFHERGGIFAENLSQIVPCEFTGKKTSCNLGFHRNALASEENGEKLRRYKRWGGAGIDPQPETTDEAGIGTELGRMSPTSSARVLVIDDNPSIHEDFRKILCPGQSGVDTYDKAAAAMFRRSAPPPSSAVACVECESQGKEGLARVKRALADEQPFTVAFVDMRMPPGWDGLETISQLWKVQPDLLVVICSAFSDYSWEEIRRRLGESDRFLILKKPFDSIEVCQFAHGLHARAMSERMLVNTQADLVEASRMAGMAELATGVLHNVGNVLNSLNISATLVCEQLSNTRLGLLRKAVALFQEHREKGDLASFLSQDSKGKTLPVFLEKVTEHLEKENQKLLAEMRGMVRSVDHIKQILTAQQNHGKVYGVIETFDARTVIDDAVRLNAERFTRHSIAVGCEAKGEWQITADRHKVLQILVNLLRNSKQSIIEANPADRSIRIRVAESTPGRVSISVTDQGVGISAENLAKIFRFGFTTKPNGHGFGLHASVLSARGMKGDLTARSEGPGKGATFVLELPATDSSPPPKVMEGRKA